MPKCNRQQMVLIAEDPTFPSTRFQGSKLKIVDWIWEAIKGLKFNTALDAFGGTGSVCYMLKEKGKRVTYNDILKFNWCIGLALIENDSIKLTENDVDFLLTMHDETIMSHSNTKDNENNPPSPPFSKGGMGGFSDKIKYPTFVSDTFKDIYFTDEENQWIDMVVTNIGLLDNPYKKALAYFALFQACIIKRPFNLFHRKNLYIRFSEVERNFGNKGTWDTAFEVHFRKFVDEANQAVFFK